MNLDRRVLSTLLIGTGLLSIVGMIGALPFRGQTNNQLNQTDNQLNQAQPPDQAAAQTPPDRPVIYDFNASRTGIAELNPGTGTGNLNTPDTGSGNVADNSGNGTGAESSPGASTRPVPPVVQGAW